MFGLTLFLPEVTNKLFLLKNHYIVKQTQVVRVKEKINERYCFRVRFFTEFSEVHVTKSLGLKSLHCMLILQHRPSSYMFKSDR